MRVATLPARACAGLSFASVAPAAPLPAHTHLARASSPGEALQGGGLLPLLVLLDESVESIHGAVGAGVPARLGQDVYDVAKIMPRQRGLQLDDLHKLVLPLLCDATPRRRDEPSPRRSPGDLTVGTCEESMEEPCDWLDEEFRDGPPDALEAVEDELVTLRP